MTPWSSHQRAAAVAREQAVPVAAPDQLDHLPARTAEQLLQLVDDALDYDAVPGELGKKIGDDLAEGKPTLPLIHVMRSGTAEQATCVRHAIESGGRADFPNVLAAVRNSGALDAARQHAQSEAQLAIDALSPLPPSIFKDSLLELADFAVARRF